MKIISLTLTNFKKIASGRPIEFNEDVNVLVGPNNAGKTAVLEALALGFGLPATINVNDCVNYLTKNGSCEIEVRLLFSRKDWEICLSQIKHRYQEEDFDPIPEQIERLEIIKRVTYNVVNKKIENTQIDIQPAFSSLEKNDDLTTRQRGILSEALTSIKNIDFYSFFDAPLYLDSARSIASSEQFRAIRQARVENNPQRVREKLYVIKKDDPERFDRIKNHILNVFPEIQDLTIDHDEETNNYVLKIQERFKKNSGFEEVNYDVHQTGLGMQSLVLIIANIFMNDSDIVLLDEPEIHMHPELVKKFVDIVQHISSQKQIILTTHSVPLVNSVEVEKVFSLKYYPEKRGVIAVPAKNNKDIIELFDDLGFDFKNEIFGYSPRSNLVVFVEGESDEKYLTLFGEKFSLADQIPIFETMNGRGNVFKIANTVKKLQRKKEEIGLKFLITVDKDEATRNNEWLKHNLREEQLHIWDRRQIENYLLDASAIKTMLVNKTKRSEQEKMVEGLDIQRMILECIDQQKDDVFHRFLKQIFFDWRIQDIQGIREFLDENKGKDFSEYETEFEQMFSTKFIYAKNETRKEIHNLEDWFNKKWRSKENKIRLCDGRYFLTALRKRLNEEGIPVSFANKDIIAEIQECPQDVKDFWDKVSSLATTHHREQ
ncbi:MAG: AAA family ATPase [bacterium]|nr:AAA family ATPase [bacterium]